MEAGWDDLVYQIANCPENLVERIMRVFGGIGDIYFFHASMMRSGSQFYCDGRPLLHGRDFMLYKDDVLIFHESCRS